MSKRLYVGNLSFNTSETDLQTAFASYGGSQVTLIKDQDGRSKGFAFVEVDAGQMDQAINALNGRDLDGRSLTVNEARPREERSGGGGGSYGGGGGSYGGGGRGNGGGNRW